MPSKYKSIQGWSDDGIRKLFDHLVEKCSPFGCIVEIGCWKGCSSCYLLEQIYENETKMVNKICYFVDKWSGDEYGINGVNGTQFPEFKHNLESRGYYENSSWFALIGDSVEVMKSFKGQVDSIFIDGCHTEQGISGDIDVCVDKVKNGGILCGHDYKDPTIIRVVNSKLSNVENWGSCWLWRKI